MENTFYHICTTENHPVIFADEKDFETAVNVAYIHRNASVADNRISPNTSKWGTGRYYFNPEAALSFNAVKQKVIMNQRQLYSHNRKFDCASDLYEVDGCISPLSFCKITEGEKLFSGAGQYLYMLAKNVESSKLISEEIGERIVFNDYELYPVIIKAASRYAAC